ncbi:eukaryotic initiation factor-2, alpha subunit [Toxoplasma gondii TgCatPRC2]|uniref:Eukaryotic translation initiation factor 2 subunit 1 n=17 Tax=Toxoplasma gondii TaxID=5811 RepID=B9PII8_TOXGV|nr:eukaryotic initiation factor-2, alpha subunit [Toxoplasma gondii ME49]EPR60960.1 eukaryotic initiation factor-2, alpha subunit [Toxoplasma gondii GT1]ESS35087.1 eukaryotic initiation factor-2, alpha subunit [Toxoplasma gondii VEG]KAF4639464.1 eukaryotic initiation factor-2, alpha subunit [Toxoplasma gondii]KFG37417.1 eukaryotic initiation factor-2, alpha subunit [Toxoplasma gondii GAB2-2007-GAL-DOM2]KFG66095.1 eukaryotic initiation factor-2, alpha subunit [Toxoplasma gondii RUB]KFH09797.1 |eukprot:XP_002364534.1 eukaryotic initiation factor-2, alpha subunit [Toxoplasma gondii ME49]
MEARDGTSSQGATGAAVPKADLGDCRFYEERFPDVEDLVMVKVNRIADLGAYVSLLEYNNMEGMILMSELSKRRFRSVNKLIRVGRHEVVMVLRVDPKKGYIDLSKRRVSPEDIVKCEEKFSKSKKVHQTVRHAAQKHGMKVDDLNRSVIWPLYRKYGHALDALKEAAMRPDEVFAGLEVDEEVRKSLIQDIQLRLAPQALKLRARVDVWCFGKQGIDAVKAALQAGQEVGDDEVTINIKLIAPPQYVVVTSCYDKELGMRKIEQAMKAISDKIKSFSGGDFKQQGEIVVMGGDEEKRLEELLEEANEDDSSDDEEEEEDEGMGRVEDDIPEDEVEDDEEDNDDGNA